MPRAPRVSSRSRRKSEVSAPFQDSEFSSAQIEATSRRLRSSRRVAAPGSTYTAVTIETATSITWAVAEALGKVPHTFRRRGLDYQRALSVIELGTCRPQFSPRLRSSLAPPSTAFPLPLLLSKNAYCHARFSGVPAAARCEPRTLERRLGAPARAAFVT